MTEQNDSTGKIKDDIPGPQTPGQMVRAQRENAGLTLQAVSEALHLTVHYIKSLEADEYGKLPGLTFVKGYFRAYARFLKMDVDAVLAAYERHLAAKGFRQHTHDFTANQSMGSLGGRRSDQSFAWALVAGVILVIALAAGWWFFGREMEVAIANGSSATPTPTAPATTTTPAPTQPVTTTTQPLVSQQNTFTQPANTTATTPSAVTQNPFQTSTPGVATTTAPVNGADTNAQTAAADVGVAVINATLEARQEEALLAEQAAAESAAAAEGALTEGVEEAASAPVNNTLATATTTATGGAVPLSSYTPPVSNNTAAPADADAQTVTDSTTTETAAAATGGTGPEIVTGTSGTRNITLRGNGNDRLEIRLSGNSWAEIRDGQGANLYSAMLRQGDNLVVEGAAPFAVLLGDARQAEASFNAQRIDMSSLIRSDNTARFRLGAEGVTAILREQTVVTE